MKRRNKHNLSHHKILSCNGGQLIPVGCVEVIRGDTFQHAVSMLVRAAPLVSPVMHKVDVKTFTFFVPFRLIWEKWQDFVTGGEDGDDESIPPTVTLTYTAGTPDTGTNIVGQLPDYLGVPPKINNLVVSALPFRAYNLIFNEYFRDQDLVPKRATVLTSGPDATTDVSLARAAWEKDYLTSARPWLSKGPALMLPLGSSAPVRGIGVTGSVSTLTNQNVRETDGDSVFDFAVASDNPGLRIDMTTATGATTRPQIFVDLSEATGVDIGTVREYFALLRMQEARARYGSRYTEFLAYYGIRSSDARLQRPEYLGGGKTTVQFSEVLQTAQGSDPVGEMRGHGISAQRTNRYRFLFEEDGLCMTVMVIRPRTMYMQMLHRMWFRTTKEMYYQKELEAIGQQEVYNKEVKANHAQPDGIFGYQDRYDDFRRVESTVAGEMRDVLDYWHMARNFETDPVLNADFVTCTPTDRVFAGAETIANQFYVMAYHSLRARRILAKTGRSFVF